MDNLKNYLLATGCLVILAAALTLIGGPAVLQGQGGPPTREVVVRNQGLIEFIERNVGPGDTVAFSPVEPGKRLVITDVIISAFVGNATGSDLQILRDGTVVSNVSFSPNQGYYEHSYVSGIEFTEGEILSIGNAGTVSTSAPVHFELRGYIE